VYVQCNANDSLALYCIYALHNNEQLTGPHAGLGFDVAGVETFSSGGQTTDWSFQVSVVLQEILLGNGNQTC